jgi:hypothetical protein
VTEPVSAGTRRVHTVRRVVGYSALAAGVGTLAGVLWEAVVKLPGYSVNSGGGASTTERGLTAYVAGDAWFAAIGLAVGVSLGLLAWLLLRRLGWVVVPLALIAATAAGLLCWLVGYLLGPGPFAPRLEAAAPGDVVPIELTVRAHSALLAWPFGAAIALLVGSAVRADDEHRPGRRTPPELPGRP